MITFNLNTESQSELGSAGKSGSQKSSNSDLFTQLLGNALKKNATVLDPKEAMQRAQTPTFQAKSNASFEDLTQKALQNIAREGQAKEESNNENVKKVANKAYLKAKDIEESPTLKSPNINTKDSKNAEKTEAKNANTESKTELKTTEKQDSKNTQNLQNNKQDSKLVVNKNDTKTAEGIVQDTKNTAAEQLANTKRELEKTTQDILTQALQNNKKLADKTDKAKQEQKANAKDIEAKSSKDIKDSKNQIVTNKLDIKNDAKIVADSKTQVETKSTESKLNNTAQSMLTTKSTIPSLNKTIAEMIALLLDNKASTKAEDKAAAFKQGLEFSNINTKNQAALLKLEAELKTQGISLEEILSSVLEDLQFEGFEFVRDGKTNIKQNLQNLTNIKADSTNKDSKTTTNTNKITEQIVQDIKGNLRDTVLSFISGGKEMPQTIMGLSKNNISNAEIAADIKEITQKLNAILKESLQLTEADKKAITKEILIQNLLKDTGSTTFNFNKQDLLLLRANTSLAATNITNQNANSTKNQSPQEEILAKILNNSKLSMSLIKELSSSLKTYQEQADVLKNFADFAKLNLKNFQFSTETTSQNLFNDFSIKNPTLNALLQQGLGVDNGKYFSGFGTQQANIAQMLGSTNGIGAKALATLVAGSLSNLNDKKNEAPTADIKHPLMPKLADLNAKTAAMLGVKADFTYNEAGKITLNELIAQQKEAIQKAVENTKEHGAIQRDPRKEGLDKALQEMKDEIFKETFGMKKDAPTEEQIISSVSDKASTKKETKRVTTIKDDKDKDKEQKTTATDDKKSSATAEKTNSTHAPKGTEQNLKLEQSEFEKKQIQQQEIQKMQNQNTTLLTPETKRKAAIAGANNVLDILSAKVKTESKKENLAAAAVVVDSEQKAEFRYQSAAAKETLRNFTGSLREGIQNYKPPLSKLTLELAPENLGNVEVTIKQRGSQLIVQIHSNPQALQLFMANANDFKQQLFGIGYENVDMTFQDADGNYYGEGSGDGGNGGQQGQQGNSDNQQGQQESSEQLLEEMQLRQEMLDNGKLASTSTWNSFGLQAYRNSDTVMQKLRSLELTLTPKYA